jgi:hypothetical protein
MVAAIITFMDSSAASWLIGRLIGGHFTGVVATFFVGEGRNQFRHIVPKAQKNLFCIGSPIKESRDCHARPCGVVLSRYWNRTPPGSIFAGQGKDHRYNPFQRKCVGFLIRQVNLFSIDGKCSPRRNVPCNVFPENRVSLWPGEPTTILRYGRKPA